jgi:hypothetical protein
MTAVTVRNSRGVWAIVILALAGLAAGCAKPQARVAAEPPPPLSVPAPPPRIILPPDPTPPPAVEEAPAPAAPPRAPRPRPAPRPDRADPPRPAETADAKPANGQEPAQTPSPAPPFGTSPGIVALEGAVRQQLSKAQEDLDDVDYTALSNALKAQYDTAKRFITLGEQALKEQNLIYAGTLADKAAAIATVLLRR